jgi:SAM-dependent methyltransferase
MSTRSENLLAPISRDSQIIEIGPSYSPIAPKAEGWKSRSIDHATREDLVAKYAEHADVVVDTSRIEEVDFVWKTGTLADAVPTNLHGSFDAFVASHVIEHTPDLIAFLDSAEKLLKPTGVVILAVPDKRYCFDYFQPLTTTGQLLGAQLEKKIRHPRELIFDHHAYFALNGGVIAWGQHPSEGISLSYTLQQSWSKFAASNSSDDYVDLHAWKFTPASFELILLELARLGKTDWRPERITEAAGCEFHAWLRRGGREAAAQLTESELEERRLALLKRSLIQIRAQIDWLLAGEPDLVQAPLGRLPISR